MKKIKALISSVLASLIFVPALAFAANAPEASFTSLAGALNYIGTLINIVIPILIGIEVLIFIFGVVRFILGAGEAEKRTEGRKYMIYSIIAIAVTVSVWGLVTFIQKTFNINDNSSSITVPSVPNLPNQ